MSTPKTEWQPARDFRRQPASWWTGRRVRLVGDVLLNNGTIYGKGSLATVTRKYGGLTLHGRNLFVKHVGYHQLEVEKPL